MTLKKLFDQYTAHRDVVASKARDVEEAGKKLDGAKLTHQLEKSRAKSFQSDLEKAINQEILEERRVLRRAKRAVDAGNYEIAANMLKFGTPDIPQVDIEFDRGKGYLTAKDTEGTVKWSFGDEWKSDYVLVVEEDKTRAYALTEDRIVVIDKDSGKIEWSLQNKSCHFGPGHIFFSMMTMIPPMGGFTPEKILLDEDSIYVASRECIRAIDKKDGSVTWEKDAYRASDIAMSRDIILYSDKHAITAVDKEGNTLWEDLDDRTGFRCMPKMIEADDKLAYIASEHGLDAVEAGTGREIWHSDRKQVFKMFKTEDNLYVLNDDHGYMNDSIVLECIDPKTGETKWKNKDVSPYITDVVEDDGKVILETPKCGCKGRESDYHLDAKTGRRL